MSVENEDLDWCIRFMYGGRQSLIVDKSIVRRLGLMEAVILTELIQRYELYASTKNTMLQADGSFFVTIPDMKNSTGLNRTQQEKAFIKLRTNKLIEQWTTGATLVQQRRWFKLNFKAIKEFLIAMC